MLSDMLQDEEATLADEERASQLVFHHLNEVTEPIDPRIRPSDRPGQAVLDETYREQLNDYLHHREPHEHHLTSTSNSDLKEKENSEFSEPIYVCHFISWYLPRTLILTYTFCPDRI